MITGGEVEANIQGFTQRPKKVGDELGTSIRGDVGGNSMLRKDMEEEVFGQLWRSDCVVCRDEDALFGETIHNH